MTVRDETTIADKENEDVNVVDAYDFGTKAETVSAADAYGTGSGIDVPFASAVASTETSAYGASPTYAAAATTNIIPAVQTQSTPTNVEGQSGNQGTNNQGCSFKNRRILSFVSIIVFGIVFFFINFNGIRDDDDNY